MPYYGNKPPPGAQVDWSNPINRGLVAWWLFNEGAGSRVTDIAGENNGFLTNMDPATDWVGSLHGGALDFDAVDDYVDVGTFSPTVLTASFWFMPSSDIHAWILQGDQNFSDIDWNWSFWQLNGEIKFRPRETSNGNDFDITASFGKWLHAAMVRDDGSGIARFYLDGEEVKKSTLTGPLNNDKIFRLGISATNNGINGPIDDVRLYDRALTAAEVRQLYHFPYGGVLRRRVRFVPAAIVTSGPPVSMQIM